jgi:hypothetical protein
VSFFPGLGAPHFNGIEIIADPYCPKTTRVQVRFPRSKRLRIQKKWRSNPRNWQEQFVMYFIPNRTNPQKILAHPEVCAVLRNFVLPRGEL